MVPLVILPMVVVVGGGVDKWCPVPWTWEVRECGWMFMSVASAADDHKVFY